MALDAQILLSLLSHESSAGDISRTLRVTPASYSASLGDGTGANQAQVAWSDARTLAGASESLNTAALSDDRGTVNLSAVKSMYFKNTSTALLTATAFGGTYPVRPAGVAVMVAPDATGMTAAGVTVAGGAGQTYEIFLIGEGTVT